MESEGYAPVLAFDTDSAQFARGVEMGRLWEQLKADGPIEQEIHAANAEMALRLAEATDRQLVCVDLGSDWLLAQYETAEPPGEGPTAL